MKLDLTKNEICVLLDILDELIHEHPEIIDCVDVIVDKIYKKLDKGLKQ